MAEARLIEIPDFDFSGFYYPDIVRSLTQFRRANVPEITDEGAEEPYTQLERSFALVGHLNNVLLDVVANETLLPTARLLESVRGHLALIDVTLSQAKPATADVVLEFSKVFTVLTEIVPINSQFATVETDESPQIIYENNETFSITRTDRPTAVFTFTAGKIKILNNSFDAGDDIQIEGVAFRNGIEWSPGGSIADTMQNITDAINDSNDDAIFGRVAAVNDGVDLISVIPLVQEVETITIVESDGATNNFEVLSGGFSANKTGLASTDAVFFNLFDDTPKAGDIIYVGHSEIMWDTMEWVFNTVGAGLSLAVEFYDATFEDAKPDSVTNLGSNLELDLTTLLGTANRKNTVVRVVLSATGAQEFGVSEWTGTKNVLRTRGLLGQATVSTNANDYNVGTQWNEASDVDDGTNGLTEDGEFVYALPQNISQNWVNLILNGVDAMWMRFRVIEATAPTNPSVDRLRIDTGKQFLLVPVTQGQTVVDDPLGSSNGGQNQEFTLVQKPLIEGTLTIEVDEGSGFQPWNSKENFLSSNSASKDYVVEIDANDNATVRFGDGVQGKIPTPGVDNIRAIYRIGADQDGNVGANTITVNKAGISFVNRVFNPRQAIGWETKEGATEQDLARLKIEGPATLRTRGRAITVADYEFLAAQFESPTTGSSPVSRALAIEETFGVKTIEVVVVGQSGALLTEAQRTEIENFFNGSKIEGIDPIGLANHEATVVNYDPNTIDVTATVTGGNEEQIKNAITALLNPDATFDDGVTRRWDFGQAVPLSVIVATIFEVDPVNIKKAIVTSPQAVGDEIPMTTRQLPLAGTVSVSVT